MNLIRQNGNRIVLDSRDKTRSIECTRYSHVLNTFFFQLQRDAMTDLDALQLSLLYDCAGESNAIKATRVCN